MIACNITPRCDFLYAYTSSRAAAHQCQHQIVACCGRARPYHNHHTAPFWMSPKHWFHSNNALWSRASCRTAASERMAQSGAARLKGVCCTQHIHPHAADNWKARALGGGISNQIAFATGRVAGKQAETPPASALVTMCALVRHAGRGRLPSQHKHPQAL